MPSVTRVKNIALVHRRGQGDAFRNPERERESEPCNLDVYSLSVVSHHFTKLVRFVQVFVVSNEEDGDPGGVVDFKAGSWRQHRLLAAIAEVCEPKKNRGTAEMSYIALTTVFLGFCRPALLVPWDATSLLHQNWYCIMSTMHT